MLTQTRSLYSYIIFGLLLVTTAQCGTGPSSGASRGPNIAVQDASANATTENGAVYLTLVNEGNSPDRLIGAETDLAEAVELHETRMDENEVMRMSPVASIEVPAGETVKLEPGGMHIMLIGLQQDLAAGDTIDVTLTFEQSGPLSVTAEVRQGVAMDHDHHEEEMAHDEAEHEHNEEHDETAGHDHDKEPARGLAAMDLAPVELAADQKLQVVATTSIIGDLVRNVAGDRIELTTLMPLGSDPHTFEPAPRDVATVADSHVVFANGLNFENFLDDLIENAGGEATAVRLAENLDPRRLASAKADQQGEQAEAEHQHGDVDPHVWTTPTNAVLLVQNIEVALSTLDPAKAATYQANAEAYTAQLEALDQWVQTQIETIPPEKRRLVTDHDTFGYYADRYGLEIVGAVIPAYSTGAEPSAQDLAALERIIDQFDVPALFVGSTVNPDLAEQVADDTGTKVISLYTGSLGPEGSSAESYIDYVRYNTNAIVTGLK